MRIEARRGLKGAPVGDRRVEDEIRVGEDEAFGRIRCPLCSWRPAPSSMWSCVSVGPPEEFPGGCGAVWNTFLTRGRCPGCSHQWRFTSCLRCNQWSLHEDWYESDIRGA